MKVISNKYSVGRAKFPISAEEYFPLPFLFLSLSFLPLQPPARVDRQIDRQTASGCYIVL